MSAPTIDTERYCWAFETWASLPRPYKEDREEAVVRRVCAHLRQHHPGVHPIETLCRVFARLIDVRRDETDPARLAFLSPGLLDIRKSCLLARLIYAGEPLRTRPCRIHQGTWSGIGFEPCPDGCNYGLQYTGWVAE